MPITERDLRILEFIKESIEKNGYAPSVRDIRDEFDIKSTSTVHAALKKLEENGYIRKEQAKSRALSVDTQEKNEQSAKIPLLGRVAAGLPILAEENIEGYVDFPLSQSELKYNKYFALRVNGESMINAGILDGDILIVKKASYADNGTIVVAGVDDEATVKRFYRENGHYRLQPENSSMEPIIVDNAYILGIVTASLRFYEV